MIVSRHLSDTLLGNKADNSRGFEDWLRAVELLERYQGRLLRVANALTEEVGEAYVQETTS